MRMHQIPRAAQLKGQLDNVRLALKMAKGFRPSIKITVSNDDKEAMSITPIMANTEGFLDLEVQLLIKALEELGVQE